LYKLVLDNANKPGVEIVCTGSVTGGATNTVELQQAGHFFTISNHA
jgi:hypothetical protein